VKLTLMGCQLAPTPTWAAQKRYMTPTASSVAWREGMGASVMISSRMITALPASSMKMARALLNR